MIPRGWNRVSRGSNRVLLTIWVRTGYCGVHDRMAPLTIEKTTDFFRVVPRENYRQRYAEYFAIYFISRMLAISEAEEI